MDIVSHGLWGGVGFGRKDRRTFRLAALFGMLPDLLSFGVHTGAVLIGLAPRTEWSHGPPPMDAIPAYVYTLYDITHSLIVFSCAFALLWVCARRYAAPFLAYGFAVLLDIPTHNTDFFATPFLWPLSDFRINGIPWDEPVIFIPNVLALGAAYFLWYRAERHARATPTEQNAPHTHTAH